MRAAYLELASRLRSPAAFSVDSLAHARAELTPSTDAAPAADPVEDYDPPQPEVRGPPPSLARLAPIPPFRPPFSSLPQYTAEGSLPQVDQRARALLSEFEEQQARRCIVLLTLAAATWAHLRSLARSLATARSGLSGARCHPARHAQARAMDPNDTRPKRFLVAPVTWGNLANRLLGAYTCAHVCVAAASGGRLAACRLPHFA